MSHRHFHESWNPAFDLPPLPLTGEGWGEGGAPFSVVVPAKAGIQLLASMQDQLRKRLTELRRFPLTPTLSPAGGGEGVEAR